MAVSKVLIKYFFRMFELFFFLAFTYTAWHILRIFVKTLIYILKLYYTFNAIHALLLHFKEINLNSFKDQNTEFQKLKRYSRHLKCNNDF